MDIIYVGNISKDNIITKNKQQCSSIGGSSVYSSFATKVINPKLNIGIVGNASDKYINLISKNKIEFLGKKISRMTEFDINELENTCVGKNYNNVSYVNHLKTKHLHISFRKGIDIEKIIENKNVIFTTLSIDVMIHSVMEFIPQIKKYEKMINIVFCNLDEYQILKEYVSNIPVVVITNNKYPIIIKQKDKILVAKVEECNNVVSDTGAGDSFIGGFLGNYLTDNNISTAINAGVTTSKLSLLNIGPIEKNQKNIKIMETKLLKLPSNIIVIGNSCAGKTTIVNEFNKYFNVYSNIDDLEPLLEVFKLDDNVRKDKTYLCKKEVIDDIKYCHDIVEEYRNQYPKIDFYKNISKNKKGHDIIRPILWDKILEYAMKNNSNCNKIIQFARGKDELYEKKYGKECYKRSIEAIYKQLENKDDILIINVRAMYGNRILRNEKRAKDGGHYVSNETMKQVYGKDHFNSEKDNEYPIFKINNKNILVYELENKQVKENEIEKYMNKKIYNIIRKYNKFKEKEDGFSKDTKGSISK